MPLFDDALKGWGPGLLIGVGAALVAPVVIPALVSVMRPLTKEAIKGYLTLMDKVCELAAEASEQLSDIMAEVQAERALAAATGAPMGTVAAGAPEQPPQRAAQDSSD